MKEKRNSFTFMDHRKRAFFSFFLFVSFSDIHNNQFDGTLPTQFQNLIGLTLFSVSNNRMIGLFFVSFCFCFPLFLLNLDLVFKMLSDSLPPSISFWLLFIVSKNRFVFSFLWLRFNFYSFLSFASPYFFCFSFSLLS